MAEPIVIEKRLSPIPILFFGRDDVGFHHCQDALAFCRANFSNVTAYLGAWKTPFPNGINVTKDTLIVSYLSRWVIPKALMEQTQRAALNFHPGPPEYPGIGCNNFAIYEGALEYGCTCHEMAEKVDHGTIVSVRRFPISQTVTVEMLLKQTYDEMFELFRDIMSKVRDEQPLPASPERWTRKPYSRKEFNELSVLLPEMSKLELERRIRATTYGHWKPVLHLHDLKFVPQDAL